MHFKNAKTCTPCIMHDHLIMITIKILLYCQYYLFLTLSDDTYFSLIDTKNKNLYYLIKKNIVGGLSIVFHRYHEKKNVHKRG